MLRAALLLLVVGQASAAQTPEDFAVRIEFGGCGLESLDSDRAEFSRMIREGLMSVATLELTAAHKRQLFELVAAVDLFGYPQQFEPASASVRELAPQYTIEIRLAGRRHVVQWVDHGSSDSSALRLRAMLRSVYAWSLSFPAVKNLPRSEMICL